MEENVSTKIVSLPELFISNDVNKFVYAGHCKIKINQVSKLLVIEPLDENFQSISASFESEYIQKENLLFAFGLQENQKFILVLKNESISTKIIQCINKNKSDLMEVDQIFLQNELKQKFLLPAIQQLKVTEGNDNLKLKEMVYKMINLLEDGVKQKYFAMLEVTTNVAKKHLGQEMDEKHSGHNLRKRKLNPLENNIGTSEFSSNDAKEMKLSSPKQKRQFLSLNSTSLISYNFQFFSFNGKAKHILFIFDSSKKTRYREYIWKVDRFACRKCYAKNQYIYAKILKDINGVEYAEIQNKTHVCELQEFDAEKFNALVLKKPDYELLEGCVHGIKRKRLFIKDSINPKMGYEYYWSESQKIFNCCECYNEKKIKISAKIFNLGSSDEYVEVSKNPHVCSTLRELADSTISIFQNKESIKIFDFEYETTMKDGVERKSLVTFDPANRDVCFKYNQRKYGRSGYQCIRCHYKKQYTIAKMIKDENDKNYILLSNNHVCLPFPYGGPTQKDIIIEAANFEHFILPNGKEIIFIFDSENKTLGYEFVKRENKFVAENYFQCVCGKNCDFYAKLCRRENGDYFTKIKDKRHVCELRKYDKDKLQGKYLYASNFQFFRNNQTQLLKLLIFCDENKKLCYDYSFSNKAQHFFCFKCKELKTHVSAKVFQNSDDNEYLRLGQNEHVCKRLAFSTHNMNGFNLIENSGLRTQKKKAVEIDENKIIKEGGFELQSSKSGIPEQKLIIFCNYEKTLCYEYNFYTGVNFFACKGCERCSNKNVSAKIHFDKDGRRFVELGKLEHICEPKQYKPEKPIIKTPNFVIHNREKNDASTKLIIFTSEDKKICYTYSFDKNHKQFRCVACYNHIPKKWITAKVVDDQSGEEYIRLSQMDHVCIPKEYNPISENLQA